MSVPVTYKNKLVSIKKFKVINNSGAGGPHRATSCLTTETLHFYGTDAKQPCIFTVLLVS